MSVVPLRTEARSRGVRMLRTALGVSVAGWLDDPATIGVMLNPDGRLWIDRLGAGVSDTGERMAAADGERVIRRGAHQVGVDVHPDIPRVERRRVGGGKRVSDRVSSGESGCSKKKK